MLPSLLIIDDFLADPLAARQKALALVADPAPRHGNYPGMLSREPLVIEGLAESVSRRIGTPVQGAPGTSHGQCRRTALRCWLPAFPAMMR